MKPTISQDTYDLAANRLGTGDISGAWQALADGGDKYARNAAAITDPSTDTFAKKLVRSTWEATVGIEAYRQK